MATRPGVTVVARQECKLAYVGKYKRLIVLSPSVERLSTWELQTQIGTDIDSIAAGQIIATPSNVCIM